MIINFYYKWKWYTKVYEGIQRYTKVYKKVVNYVTTS